MQQVHKKGVKMDNQKFGAFIASTRKEKGWTQLELAEKINVTDKAVSKWERGLGFPDIKTIEPLAEALDVSILEIMRSEHLNENQVSTANASEALVNVIDVVTYQRKIERRNILIGVILIITVLMAVFLVDTMHLEGFIFVCLPIILLSVGIWLLILSWYRHKHSLSYSITLILGILSLMFPIIICLLLYFAFMIGGPMVP